MFLNQKTLHIAVDITDTKTRCKVKIRVQVFVGIYLQRKERRKYLVLLIRKHPFVPSICVES